MKFPSKNTHILVPIKSKIKPNVIKNSRIMLIIKDSFLFSSFLKIV
jgi:hypothetical protein